MFMSSCQVEEQKAQMMHPGLKWDSNHLPSRPFVAVLGEKFGFRAVTLTGCIFGAVGIGSCYFAEDINTATICIGLVYGIGLALSATLVPTILKLHFTENINLVNGVWLAGTCAGSIIMSPVMTYLQNAYGTNGMFLIVGGIFLNCIPAAILLKHPHNDRQKCKTEKKNVADNPTTYHQNLAFVADEENQEKNDSILKNSEENSFPWQEESTENEREDIVRVKCAQKLRAVENQNKVIPDYVSFGSDQTDKIHYVLQKIGKNGTIFLITPVTQPMQHTVKKPSDKKDSTEKDFSSVKKNSNNVSEPVEPMTGTTTNHTISWKSFRVFADPTYFSIMLVQSMTTFISTLNWTILVDYGRDKGMSTEVSVFGLHYVGL
ncbi:uncharacterized protein [Parasteatoda tepidariorum]|uniref:uncharacterized protein n=1 Tax=Parasteatoda tepidariorum TaxID=114398 RepID=UPI0039BC68EA